jgi:hypothetical protein
MRVEDQEINHMNASILAARFAEGDHKRRRQVTQFFVIKTVFDDSLRSMDVYRRLRQNSGEHAAELFYELFSQAKTRSLTYLWYHHVLMTRPNRRRLP